MRSEAEVLQAEALEAIASQTYHCEACGVQYCEGYEGACQESAPNARWTGDCWSRMCYGTVSAAGTARRALCQARQEARAAS
jgi:hypothetical protein